MMQERDEHELANPVNNGFFRLESASLEDGLRAFQNYPGPIALEVNALYGCDESVFKRVLELTDVTGLSLVGLSPRMDLSNLKQMKQLRRLYIDATEWPLDLNWFPSLEEYGGPWHRSMNFENASNLRHLSLDRFCPATQGVSDLCHAKQLVEVTLTKTSIVSLVGVEQLANLRRLQVAYARKLATPSNAELLPRLEEAEFYNCPQLCEHDVFQASPVLHTLRFLRCGTMPSLSFIEKMVRLSHFSFVGTRVIDGDMRPLLRLESAGFDSRKEYSHSWQEVANLISSRH